MDETTSDIPSCSKVCPSGAGSGVVTQARLILSGPHCRLLEEESSKRAELEKWHLEQQQAIQMTEAEKQELENQRVMKEQALQEAMQQLEQLELERKQALEQYEVSLPLPMCAFKFFKKKHFLKQNICVATKSCSKNLA